MGRPRLALLGVLALVLTTPPAAATASPSGYGDAPPPSIPQRYLDQPITWAPCEFDAKVKQLYPQAPTTDCATVKVPMDWHNPDAHRDIKLAITHSKATGTSKGLLATNLGGPAPSRERSALLAAARPSLFANYDLLSLDPRGFGLSELATCRTTQEEVDALPSSPDWKERTQQTLDAEIAEARLVADACAKSEFIPFVNTQQIVYDVDFLRELLHAPKLNYVGYSYGTQLGSWYADTYPARVGRFLLDANMSVDVGWQQHFLRVPASGQRRFDTQFVPWLVRHADQTGGLGASPAQVQAKYDAIRTGLVDLVKAGKSSVRGDSLDRLIFGDLYSNPGLVKAALDLLVRDEYLKAPPSSGRIEIQHVDGAWARLGDQLRPYYSLEKLRASYNMTPAARTSPGFAARHVTAAAAGGPIDFDAGYESIQCQDTRYIRDIDWYRRTAERQAAQYPLLGWLNGVPPCAFWKFPAQGRKIDLKGAPRILMVQSELDPVTPYEGALQVHRKTPRNTRLVSVDDEGKHGMYILGSSECVHQIGDRFLFDGVLPAEDVVCATTPLPGDSVVYPVRGPVNGRAAHSTAGESTTPAASVLSELIAADGLRQ